MIIYVTVILFHCLENKFFYNVSNGLFVFLPLMISKSKYRIFIC